MHLSWKPRTPVVTRASSTPMLRLWVLGPGFSPLGNCCFFFIYIYIYIYIYKFKFGEGRTGSSHSNPFQNIKGPNFGRGLSF
jgi:hypothetical protein